jgi:LysR family transcriptional regulator, cell division regulator
MRQLEDELGVALLHRHSRGVTVTDAGAQLLPYARKIASLLTEARRAATDRIEPSGELSIGSMETTAACRLPPMLLRYAQSCPNVDVILHTGTSAGLTQNVLDHEIEGALVAAPVTHPDLIAVPVVEEELVVISSPRIGCLEELSRSSMDGVKILVFRSGCSYRLKLENLLGELKVRTARKLELGTLEGIIGCVSAGLGISLLPRAVVTAHAQAGILNLHVLPDASKRFVTTMFIRRKDGFLSQALKQFISCAVDQPCHDINRPPTLPGPLSNKSPLSGEGTSLNQQAEFLTNRGG